MKKAPINRPVVRKNLVRPEIPDRCLGRASDFTPAKLDPVALRFAKAVELLYWEGWPFWRAVQRCHYYMTGE